MNTQELKRRLRRELLREREEIPLDQHSSWSNKICSWIHFWLTQSEAGKQVQWVGCFLSHKGEPDLRSLLDEVGIGFSRHYKTALPVISKTQDGVPDMDFYLYRQSDELVPNRYGIKEPVVDQRRLVPRGLKEKTLILVPAIAVDGEGHRLGYGGGFYDRYLAKKPEILSLAVVYEKFVLPKIPTEPHDQRLSGYVTQSGVTLL